MEREVTESWKDKIYEKKFTEYYFEILEQLRRASNFPIINNLKMAFNSVRAISYGTVFSRYHMIEFNIKVKPVLDEINTILYGKIEDAIVMRMMEKYGMNITQNRHGRVEVNNAQNIIKQLWEILFFIKQWAYEEGFFVVKPFSRRVGTDAIEDAMAQ